MSIQRASIGAAWLVAVVLGVSAGLALADGQTASSADAEQQAIERFCVDRDPCVIINGDANPAGSDREATLVSPGQALLESGKPPSACPKAEAAYRDIGIAADAFVGPCPEGPVAVDATREDLAEAVRSNDQMALAAREAMR